MFKFSRYWNKFVCNVFYGDKLMTNINTPFENIKPCDYDYVITTLQEQLEQKDKEIEGSDYYAEKLKARNEKLERVVEAAKHLMDVRMGATMGVKDLVQADFNLIEAIKELKDG